MAYDAKPWSPDDDRVLIGAHRLGLSIDQISGNILSRTPDAISSRLRVLRRIGRIPPVKRSKAIHDAIGLIDTQARASAEAGSKALLRSLLRFGLRHGVDLGMGSEAFFAAARQNGIVVMEHV